MNHSGPKLAVDARPLSGPHNGFSVYTAAVVETLLSANWQISLLSNRPIHPRHGFAATCDQKIFGTTRTFRWEQKDLYQHLRDNSYDVYFAGANRGIPWRSLESTVTVLGLLDMIPYLFPGDYIFKYPFHFLRHELVAQWISIWKTDEIITISEQSAKDVKRLTRRPATPMLIPLPATDSSQRGPAKKRFVYVGGVDPRKRIDNLLRAFARFVSGHPDFNLILIGLGFERFRPLIAELNISQQVQLTGYLDDAEKMRLLASSTALVYPSLYEGYGLVIAEGFRAKTNVISGRGGSQAEVGGDAVVYIDPDDATSIVKGMERVIDPKIANELKQRGQHQLAKLEDPAVSKKIVEFFNSQTAKRGARI